MACTAWKEQLIGRLYGEFEDGDDALSAHLDVCADCRRTLEEFRGVRTALSDDASELAPPPRVLVLHGRSSRLRPLAWAASLLGAALLAGAGAGAGYAVGKRAGPPAVASPAGAAAAPSAAATEELVRREVERRLDDFRAAQAQAPATPEARAVTSPELRAELAKLEKKMNGMRATDLDYVLDQIGASEYRTGTRIGKTNEALRTVALASNPYVNEQ